MVSALRGVRIQSLPLSPLTDEVVLKAKEMATLQRPSNRDWRGVRDWIVDHKPLVDDEREFIMRREDIVTLRVGRECAGFDGAVERALSKLDRILVKYCHCRLIQVCPSSRQNSKTAC